MLLGGKARMLILLLMTVFTVNVVKFQTLYFVLLRPKFCFLCSCFLKYLLEWQTVQTPLSSLIWVYAICHTWVYKILGHLPYPRYWNTLLSWSRILTGSFYCLNNDVSKKKRWVNGKQRRPWSDAMLCIVWSWLTLFAQICLSQYIQLKK